jgi:hypothetical protein
MKSPLLQVGLWVNPCLTLYGAPRITTPTRTHTQACTPCHKELAPHRAVGILALHIPTLFTQRHGDLIILLPWMASEDQIIILRNPQSPSPPSLMSKSTNKSRNGTHRATGGPTPQGTPSYTTTARKTLSDERFQGAAGASPPATSVPSQPSRRRDHRPTDNGSIAIPSEASTGHRAATECRDTSQFNVELDVQSRAGQVSSSLFVIHTNGPSL